MTGTTMHGHPLHDACLINDVETLTWRLEDNDIAHLDELRFTNDSLRAALLDVQFDELRYELVPWKFRLLRAQSAHAPLLSSRVEVATQLDISAP